MKRCLLFVTFPTSLKRHTAAWGDDIAARCLFEAFVSERKHVEVRPLLLTHQSDRQPGSNRCERSDTHHSRPSLPPSQHVNAWVGRHRHAFLSRT